MLHPMKEFFPLVLFASLWVSSARAECIVIDGPANLRKEPKGEIIHSLPDLSTVWVNTAEEKKEGWIPVHFSISKSGKVLCSNDPDESGPDSEKNGWIAASNRKKASFNDLLKIDRLGALWSGASRDSAQTGYSASLKTACSCGAFQAPAHDRMSGTMKSFTKGEKIRGECALKNGLVSCAFPYGDTRSITVCPSDCTDLKPLVKLSPEMRLSLVATARAQAIEQVKKLAPKTLLNSVESRFPKWVPLLVPHPKRLTEFTYDLELVPSCGAFEFPYETETKKRNVLLFFSDSEAVIQQTPMLAFEGKGNVIEYRKLPYSLKNSENHDQEPPVFCMAHRKDFYALVGCRQQDEISVPIAYLNFIPETPIQIQKEIYEKALAQDEHDYSCCDTGNHPEKYQGFQ